MKTDFQTLQIKTLPFRIPYKGCYTKQGKKRIYKEDKDLSQQQTKSTWKSNLEIITL